ERRVALTPRDDLEELAVVVDDVELSASVLAEGDDVVERVTPAGSELGRAVDAVLRVATAHAAEGPDEGLAVVRVEIRAAEIGHAAAAVDESAGDRAGRAVGVLEDGQGETVGGIRAAGRGVRLETMPALEDVPAVVLAARARRRLHVHFLPRILTDVADVEIPGHAVEAEAPRVADSERPDLVQPRIAWSHEGVARRRDVVGRRLDVHVEPQELAEEHGRILGVLERITTTAAVAGAGVEVTVGT